MMKTGKTTISTKFPNNLLFAFEAGYHAIPNIFVVPINTWAEALSYQAQLLKDAREVKKALEKDSNCGAVTQFETITIDTSDIAYSLCESYVCSQNGVDAISKIPYGGGYRLVEKEFDEFFRRFTNAGYGLVIISHEKVATIKDDQGNEYQRITSTLSATPKKIVNRLCDIIGYVKPVTAFDKNGTESVKTYMFLRGTSKWEAGSRFKYMPDYIEFSYDSLVNAIGDAIDEEAKHGNAQYVTDKKMEINTETQISFDDIFAETNNLITKLLEKDEKYFPVIKEIIEKRLGMGKLLRDATRVQTEQVNMILFDLKEYLNENNIQVEG